MVGKETVIVLFSAAMEFYFYTSYKHIHTHIYIWHTYNTYNVYTPKDTHTRAYIYIYIHTRRVNSLILFLLKGTGSDWLNETSVCACVSVYIYVRTCEYVRVWINRARTANLCLRRVKSYFQGREISSGVVERTTTICGVRCSDKSHKNVWFFFSYLYIE